VPQILLNTLLILMMFVYPSSSQAQGTPHVEWDAACVTSSNGDVCSGWSNVVGYQLGLYDPDCIVKLDYKVRICTTSTGQVYIDYFITGWELVLGCEGWDVKQYYHQKFNGLKDYIILGLLTRREGGSVPDCNSNPLPLVSNVYTAACGVWSCCEYEIKQPQIPVCDGYWSGPPPHYGVPAKVKSCKWVDCGTVCCQRKYSVCYNTKTVEGNTITSVDVKLLSKQKLGDCSGQLPSPSQPCEDGC
jgi:hypothetical protein